MPLPPLPLPRALTLAAALATLGAGCAALAPLREPPPLSRDDPAAGLRTRADAVTRLGRPHEVRASDAGEILVYRRVRVAESNPNRYYGQDRGTRLDRYELLLLVIDQDGRVVRTSVEPE